MKQFGQYLILLIVFLANGFLFSGKSLARDEEGCLTCHRFPGLVRQEAENRFAVLYIDEEKFAGSAHGKFRCRKCHFTVTRVPHTDETKVNCTVKCHDGKAAKVLPQNYVIDGFHKSEQSYLINLKDDSSCRVCHPLYPHTKNNLVRAILNMHNGFMLCEVCHIKHEKFDNLSYEWENTENALFSGEPFGTYFNPRIGKTFKDENFISRVAAFSTENGNKKSLMNIQDTEKAKAFLLTSESLDNREREKELSYFHRDIRKKEMSAACNECHSSNSILDFKKLGFEEKRIKNLVDLNIKGLVSKYNIFYLPNLFGN